MTFIEELWGGITAYHLQKEKETLNVAEACKQVHGAVLPLSSTQGQT